MCKITCLRGCRFSVVRVSLRNRPCAKLCHVQICTITQLPTCHHGSPSSQGHATACFILLLPSNHLKTSQSEISLEIFSGSKSNHIFLSEFEEKLHIWGMVNFILLAVITCPKRTVMTCCLFWLSMHESKADYACNF